MPEPKWSGRIPSSSGGGSSTLTGLTDVTGPPNPGTSPVYDHTGVAPLTPVTTQDDLDQILAQVVWHKAAALEQPWEPSNPTVVLTPDGVQYGPYTTNAEGGSLRYHGLDGQPFTSVTNLAFDMRYLEDGEHAELSPYLRVFLQDAAGTQHDAIFSPGSQPYTGQGCGPFQEFVATSGFWRYDQDAGTGGVPLDQLQATYGDQTITKLTITLGFTGGTNLHGLLRWWQINGDHHVFGA